MDPKEILKLIDAGFTADEIRKMMPAQPAEPTGQVETKVEPKKEEPKEAPKEEPKTEIVKVEKPELVPAYDEIIAGLNEKIDELTGAVSKISKISLFPAMDNIKPLGIDDVIDKFFKEE